MKYTVVTTDSWHKPYYYNKPKSGMCDSTCVNSYSTSDKKIFNVAIRDLMDVPESELTKEHVESDFGSIVDEKLSIEKIQKIMDYYNGRLALYNDIKKALKSNHDKPNSFIWDIPKELASFCMDDSDKHETLLRSSIEITISEDDEKKRTKKRKAK